MHLGKEFWKQLDSMKSSNNKTELFTLQSQTNNSGKCNWINPELQCRWLFLLSLPGSAEGSLVPVCVCVCVCVCVQGFFYMRFGILHVAGCWKMNKDRRKKAMCPIGKEGKPGCWLPMCQFSRIAHGLPRSFPCPQIFMLNYHSRSLSEHASYFI